MEWNEASGSTRSMVQALVYLRLTMLRNMALSFVRRIKQPRYLLGVLMAGAYFWLVLFRRPGAMPRGGGIPVNAGESVELFTAALVTVVLMSMWLLSGGKPSLGFTEAEVAFLFPAPLKRSQLIHYKLLSNLLVGFFGSVFFMLLSTRGQGGLWHLLQYWISWWLVMALIGLHNTAAAFTLYRLGDSNTALWLRRAVVAVLIVAFLLLAAYLQVSDSHERLQQVLLPGHLLVKPFFADNFAAFVQAIAVVVALLGLHYYWVLKLETPFEEASIALAARRATLLAQMRAGKGFRLTGKAKARREPFALQAWMPVELVLLWKNLMLGASYLNRRTFVGSILLVIFGMRWLHAQNTFGTQGTAGILGVVALVMLAYMLLLGPQFARIDLRNDLAQADLLKAWPLSGWRIVLGNMLAPAVFITAIGWVLLLTGLTGITSEGKLTPWLTLPLKISLGVCGGIFLPALAMLMLIGPNAMALYFPAWTQMGAAGQRGFDVMGLRILLSLGQLLLLVFSLLPASLVGSFTFYLSQWFLSQEYGIALATLVALVVLVLEILFAIHLLGERFEKLDIAAELRQ